MLTVNKKRFFNAAKGKVIIGFLFACFALLLAWGISRFAFKKMLNTVSEISAPNDRLRFVNQLSHSISRLDQLQRDKAVNKNTKNKDFITEQKNLKSNLDTLSKLYAQDKVQLQRINSIKKLLADRDKQFAMYLQVRETLVNTKSFSAEVEKLNELVAQRSRDADSAILTTETATSTTTIAPEQEEKSRGFLSKLFGKKKAEVYKIINEEFKIKRDTLNAKVEDSIINNIEASLKLIENEQKDKSAKFLKREAVLANASAKITQQTLNILREVEAEAVAQVDANSTQAKEVVNKGITQITWVLVAFFLLTVILVYLILSDITSINRYRKQLEIAKDEAEYHGKAKQRFLSNMSHEIRTPLQSILGYAELIAHQKNPNKKDVDAIYQSAVHLLQIVNEVLDYNRIISGEFSFYNQVFNINKVINEVLAVMRPLAEQKSIKLISKIDLGDVNHIEGDPFRLKQILFNLLGNAIKFTIKGEVILALNCKRQHNDVHFNFTIKDTGVGFDEQHINRIFNEFEQIESDENRAINQTGTGLGLAIVKSLVENQDGRISVKSQKNKGTTFNIYLTYKYADKPENEALNAAKTKLVNTGKVWIVDDDRLILDLCGIIFEENDIPYESFDQASMILNAVPDDDINYVLLDMRLPEMSGLELHKLLKAKLPPATKFYAITAQVLPDEREAILAEGFEGLITKPFRADDILSIFDRTVNLPTTVDFDLTQVEKMTMGDQQLLERILNQFKQDCNDDMQLLAQYSKQNDKDNCRLIVHRLAGRTGQIGAKDLAADFRNLELEIEEGEMLTSSLTKKIDITLVKLKNLMLLIEELAYSMP